MADLPTADNMPTASREDEENRLLEPVTLHRLEAAMAEAESGEWGDDYPHDEILADVYFYCRRSLGAHLA